IVINDRSTDGTGAILRELAQQNRRLQIVDISELPAGWLGKNNALQNGAGRATKEVLLFMDADVVLTPDALSRAVRLLESSQSDHLTLAPDLITPSWILSLVVKYFMLWFFLWLRPWRTRDPRSSA